MNYNLILIGAGIYNLKVIKIQHINLIINTLNHFLLSLEYLNYFMNGSNEIRAIKKTCFPDRKQVF